MPWQCHPTLTFPMNSAIATRGWSKVVTSHWACAKNSWHFFERARSWKSTASPVFHTGLWCFYVEETWCSWGGRVIQLYMAKVGKAWGGKLELGGWEIPGSPSSVGNTNLTNHRSKQYVVIKIGVAHYIILITFGTSRNANKFNLVKL